MALALSLWVALTTMVVARLVALPLPNSVRLKSYEAFSKMMSNFSELPCPLDKCNHGKKGLFASKRFPQWFSLCTSKWHFCGVCSSGELFSPLQGRCVKSKWKPNDHFTCLANRFCTPFKNTQGVVWLRKDDRSFILCTGNGNMCGFCPGNTRFNLQHQICHHAEPTSLEDVDSSNALITFDNNVVVSKTVSLRNTHNAVRVQACCHDCVADSNLSLISYLRRCRF